jgi:hypothetical protein
VADHEIDFNAPASLRKHPSLNAQRHHNVVQPTPYLLLDGTLDECIKEFMSKPAAMHHLYEIHTKPQPPLVTEVLQAKLPSLILIVEVGCIDLRRNFQRRCDSPLPNE